MTTEKDAQVEMTERKNTIKKVAVSSFLGNFIEWFDYATYSYFATTIAAVFFPTGDETLALLQTFAVFAIAFLFRPVGAIVWGSLGDRLGRKWSLSMSIYLMTGATFLIGLLPGFNVIGFAAPAALLVLRIVQGFSASGEYAGAATFLSEYAPTNKRGLYCSLVPASTAVGLFVGMLFATVMSAFMDAEALVEWGWRVPFLIAGPLGLIAHYIRTRLEDSEVYQKMQDAMSAQPGETKTPVVDLVTKHPKKLLLAFFSAMLNAVGFYVVLTYLPTYLTTFVGMDPTTADIATNISLLVYIAFIFATGALSDRFGRKKMLIAACVCFIVLTVPAFFLLNSGEFFTVLIVEMVMCFCLTINDGTLSSYLTETFPTEVRYTGFAFSFNLANALFGGTASMFCTYLIMTTGNNLAPAYYMIGIAVIALIAMILSHEHSGKDLSEIE